MEGGWEAQGCVMPPPHSVPNQHPLMALQPGVEREEQDSSMGGEGVGGTGVCRASLHAPMPSNGPAAIHGVAGVSEQQEGYKGWEVDVVV